MANRIFETCYQVQVIGKNGTWFSFVIAIDEENAIKKTKEAYKNSNSDVDVIIITEYDYYIK